MLLASLGLVLGAVAAPWLLAHGHTEAAQVVYRGFYNACHQNADRSFSLFGAPMAVCARCTGLYLGALLGTILLPLLRGVRAPVPSRAWLAAAALPCALDVGLDWSGIVINTFATRGATGLLLGAVAPFYVVPAFFEAFQQGTVTKHRRG